MNNMKVATESYCTHKVARILEKKGFEFNMKTAPMGLPTHAIAINWVRENFGVEIIVMPFEWKQNKKWYCFNIWQFETVDCIGFGFKVHKEKFSSVPKATEEALLYALKNLIP